MTYTSPPYHPMMIDFSKKRVCCWCGRIGKPDHDVVAVIEDIGICYPCYCALPPKIKFNQSSDPLWARKLRNALPDMPIDIEM